MKRLFRLFLCLALLSGTAACSDDEVSQNLIVINGGEHFLSLDGLARAGKISVLAPAPWRVTKAAGDTWFRLSATEGPAGYSEVELSLDENPGAARSAQLAFACGDAIVPFRLSQGALSAGYDSPDYYFYVTFGTMPTLYAGIHLLSHDKPGYVFYSRSKTFDPAEFPARAEVTTAADRTADATQAEMEAMAREMKRRILEINSADPTAVFGLYVDDLRCRIGYDWFVAQGIDSARVKVSMLSDGTGTYNNFYNYFGDAATAEQNWESYASEVEALDWNHGGRYPETRSLPEFESYTWPYYLSTRPDYRLVVQDGSLLESSCPFITEKLGEMEIESIQPYEMLSALPESSRKRFYDMAGFDYDNFAALFDASPKKNLIIIGTSHADDASARLQRDYVARIVEQYGEGYDIFFKPHPADTSSAGYEIEFPGLTLLPGQMPFEIFVWALIDRVDMIGGYPSTVFLTVPLDKVRFIFAANAESMARPLNILFRDATDVEWMQ